MSNEKPKFETFISNRFIDDFSLKLAVRLNKSTGFILWRAVYLSCIVLDPEFAKFNLVPFDKYGKPLEDWKYKSRIESFIGETKNWHKSVGLWSKTIYQIGLSGVFANNILKIKEILNTQSTEEAMVRSLIFFEIMLDLSNREYCFVDVGKAESFWEIV